MNSSADFLPDPISRYELKRRLRRTWSAFFARFGNFTTIQEGAIPLILQGRNIFLSSKTASGKTEAVMAPLTELMLDRASGKPSGIYISPTKALCNDALKRLKPPMDALNVAITRRTGDHPEGFKPTAPPDIFITTPESLDSIMTNYPQTLVPLNFAVLDEIHLLDNSARGDQLRVLLHRLERIRRAGGAKAAMQYAALSATVRDPHDMGSRYFTPVTTVSDITPRKIDAVYVDARDPQFLAQIIEELRTRRIRKTLAFCNSRADCEYLAKELDRGPYTGKVYVHHGSLTKNERERVEEHMNADTIGICVATMTLELGIDIGDIECIILYAPPHSVSSFLQRIGRGCRRKGDYSLAVCVFHDTWQLLLYETLLCFAGAGEVDDVPYFVRHSVAVQQLFSYLKQTRRNGATRNQLTEMLSPLWEPYESFKCGQLIDELLTKGYATLLPSKLYGIGRKLGDLIEQHQIYTNISGGLPGFTPLAIDAQTGKALGEVATEDLHEGSYLALGGRTWQVKSIKKRQVFVTQVKDFTHKVAVIPKTAPPLGYWLAQRIKQIMLGITPQERCFLVKSDREYILFHFLGRIWGTLMATAITIELTKTVTDVGGIAIIAAKPVTPALLIAAAAKLNLALQAAKGQLAADLQMGPFFSTLPSAIQREDLAEGSLVDKLRELMRRLELVEADAQTVMQLGPALGMLD